MKDSLENTLNNTQSSVEKFKDTIAKKHGVIYCEGPNGEVWECRTLREAEARTGVRHNSICYALKHSGISKGWKFERNAAN